jgi:hypothetical protein
LPALVFDQYMVNLREIEPTDRAFAHFVFVNTSDRAVRITGLVPTCSCLQPRIARREIAPGAAGDFVVTVLTANQTPGPKEYQILVRYEDPDPRETSVAFRLVIPEEQVFVRPRSLVIYQGSQAAPHAQELRVFDLRPQTLSVTSVETNSPLVSARLVADDAEDADPTPETAQDSDADGTPAHRIRLRLVDDIPVGRHRAMVRIRTNDRGFPELIVPLLIVGENGPDTAMRSGVAEPGSRPPRRVAPKRDGQVQPAGQSSASLEPGKNPVRNADASEADRQPESPRR